MKKSRILPLAIGLAAMLALGGCTRNQINYQVAECIGTVGQYDNNEPVETPKMKAEREMREAEEQLQNQQQNAMEVAEKLALSYEYEAAINYLQNEEALRDYEGVEEKIAEYQNAINSMYEYDGTIGHLCFTNLVVDPKRAFDGDEYSSIYKSNMITLDEFEKMLDSLYTNGYILIDIHSLAEELADSRGDVTLKQAYPYIPNGKKPLILSVENLDYSSIRNGDGVATKLAIDKEGNVGALYTDDEGHDLIGAYDVVPVVEKFIAEHPDFSFKGARGIIGLSGSNGILGYDIESDAVTDAGENLDTVRQIASKLKEDGWHFACEGYSYQYLGDMNYETLKNDINKWQSNVGNLVGPCDVLLYPFGSEVDYATEKASLLINQGFHYLVGLWSDGDHLEVNSNYLRQTRRTVTGYVLQNYPSNLTPYISTAGVIDSARR